MAEEVVETRVAGLSIKRTRRSPQGARDSVSYRIKGHLDAFRDAGLYRDHLIPQGRKRVVCATHSKVDRFWYRVEKHKGQMISMSLDHPPADLLSLCEELLEGHSQSCRSRVGTTRDEVSLAVLHYLRSHSDAELKRKMVEIISASNDECTDQQEAEGRENAADLVFLVWFERRGLNGLDRVLNHRGAGASLEDMEEWRRRLAREEEDKWPFIPDGYQGKLYGARKDRRFQAFKAQLLGAEST